MQSDDDLLSLLRYVERNPLPAGLVKRSSVMSRVVPRKAPYF